MIRSSLAALVLGLSVATAAQAHAFLDHAVPKVGAVLQEPPAEVRLWFGEAVEPAFSSIEVLDASGRRVQTGPVQVDGADRMVLRVALPPLPSGAYVVRWRAVSVDTHATEGRFGFRIQH